MKKRSVRVRVGEWENGRAGEVGERFDLSHEMSQFVVDAGV